MPSRKRDGNIITSYGEKDDEGEKGDPSLFLFRLKAWFRFRQHVLTTLVPVFYSIPVPFISLLVLCAFSLSVFWVCHLLIVCGGSSAVALESVVSANTLFVLFCFTALFLMTTMYILGWIMKPYEAQRAQIRGIKGIKSELVFRLQHEGIKSVDPSGDITYDMWMTGTYDGTYDEPKRYIEKDFKEYEYNAIEKQLTHVIAYCDHLIGSMEGMYNDPKHKPKILGVRITEAKVLAFRGYTLAVVLLFVASSVHDYTGIFSVLFV